jgi:hypothetical protein
VDLDFELQFEDVLRSLDVDEKTVEPSLDLFIKSYVWDLSLVAQDTIDYSNEFNVERKDAIEFGVELNLFPFYLPTLDVESQRLLDTQENLEDKVEEKLDANLEYELTDLLSLSLSWKEETTDDRLFDNNDLDSHDWEFNLDYGQAMTSSLKVDFQTNWSGRREDTLNNAGQILNIDQEHLIDNNLKFSLDTFPDFESALEIGYINDFVENGDETSIDFSVGYDQPVVDLGTLTESFSITRENVDLTTEKTTDVEIDLEVELAGEPDKYLDYSIKYTLGLSDHEDGIDPTADSDGQEDEFNFSVTLTPNEKTTIENSYNWSASRLNGVRSGSSRDIKIEGTFEGEMFNVPNLIVSPLLEMSKEKDFITSEITDVFNLELDLLYSVVLPPNASWELGSVYTWEREDELERALEFTSEFSIEFIHSSWEIEFEEEASTEIEYDGEEPVSWEHDFSIDIAKDLTHAIRFDASYSYEYDGDGANSDEVETNLEWRYRSAFLSFSYSRSRVFEGPKDVVRVYNVEASIEF